MADMDSFDEGVGPGQSGWLLAGYAGVAGFLVVEATVRKPGTASSLDASGEDHNTTRRIIVGYLSAALLTPLLHRWRRGRLPLGSGPLGLTIQAAGLGMRVWSMRTLAQSYSRTLRTSDDQKVVESGPYRFVRHPGYAGSLLTWIGFGITSGSVPVIGLVAGLLGPPYWLRITTEEKLLRQGLPGYIEYSDRTKRLIPRIW
jgi:protein-S-isoprenylcysteine O-methyltransferase Ste14